MRKLRLFAHISLDGVIEHDSDSAYGAWTAKFRSPVGPSLVIEAQGASFDLVLGRRTYDLWSGYWPTVGDHPIGNSINAARKYVATHRPESLGWGPVEDLGPDIVERIRTIKAQDGPDLILWGSSTLTSVLLGQGLFDEMVLFVYPVLLGRGKRILADTVAAREFAFVSTKTTPTGVFRNTYRYVGALQPR